MNKFKNRLASIVLSTITLAGGVTTCLISDSAVHQCQANIKNKEMKKLINEALKDCFKQNTSLPQITADNLKTVLKKALGKITKGNNGTPLTEEARTKLQTPVNTFLFVLWYCLVNRLLSHPETPELQPITIDELAQILRETPPDSTMPGWYAGKLTWLMDNEVANYKTYFPEEFFCVWSEIACYNHNSTALQTQAI